MTKWLQRQEAVAWFSNYQAWRCRTAAASPLDSAESPLSNDSEHHLPHQYIEPHTAPVPSACQSRYRLSRRPQFPRKTIQYLEQHHGAVRFLDALKMFVNTLPRGRQYCEPNVNDRFDIFTNMVLITPLREHMATNAVNSRIRSHPQCSNGVRKPPTLARHDTVLVDVDTELRQQRGGLHGMLI